MSVNYKIFGLAWLTHFTPNCDHTFMPKLNHTVTVSHVSQLRSHDESHLTQSFPACPKLIKCGLHYDKWNKKWCAIHPMRPQCNFKCFWHSSNLLIILLLFCKLPHKYWNSSTKFQLLHEMYFQIIDWQKISHQLFH